MKKAIINYINARTEKVKAETEKVKAETEKTKPCQHNWELLNKTEYMSRSNKKYSWFKWTYFCKKCGEYRIFEND